MSDDRAAEPAVEESRTVEHRYYRTTYYPANISHTCRLCPTSISGGSPGVDAHMALHLAEHALAQLDAQADAERERMERAT